MSNWIVILERNESGELVLRLRSIVCSEMSASPAPATEQPRRMVTFTPDTVDNEHFGRLKSNCCCIYLPPRVWDDRSTWDRDEKETEHCRGHTIPLTQAKTNLADGQSEGVPQNTSKNSESEVNAMPGEPLFDEDDFNKAFVHEEKILNKNVAGR